MGTPHVDHSRKVGATTSYLLWVDGVVESDQLEELQRLKGLLRIEQRKTYLLAWFSRPQRWPRFLDPHRWVTQVDERCTHLDVNFCPTGEELAQLRQFLQNALRIGHT